VVTADARVDLAEESDSFVLCNALAQGSRGRRVPKQLGSDDDIIARAASKLLVLLSLGVAFVVLDEVDDGRSPIGVKV